jgi:hypothetical protein
MARLGLWLFWMLAVLARALVRSAGVRRIPKAPAPGRLGPSGRASAESGRTRSDGTGPELFGWGSSPAVMSRAAAPVGRASRAVRVADRPRPDSRLLRADPLGSALLARALARVDC